MQMYEAVESVLMVMMCEVVDVQKAQAEERSDRLYHVTPRILQRRH